MAVVCYLEGLEEVPSLVGEGEEPVGGDRDGGRGGGDVGRHVHARLAVRHLFGATVMVFFKGRPGVGVRGEQRGWMILDRHHGSCVYLGNNRVSYHGPPVLDALGEGVVGSLPVDDAVHHVEVLAAVGLDGLERVLHLRGAWIKGGVKWFICRM